VLLVSLTVDPDHDTPEVLSDYARRFDADPKRWWFLNGPKAATYELIRKGFLLPVEESSPADVATGAETIGHSSRLVLMNGNKTEGIYDSNDPGEVAYLLAQARRLDRGAIPGWVRLLPPVNATLNGLSGLVLAIGWFFIRSGNARAHATCMIVAVVLSGLFLTSYLIYHGQVGSKPFEGTGTLQLVYYTILFSHTALATLGVVPLVALTLFRAWKKEFHRHAAIARVTFPIWMYVSVTGVIIYFMLYQLPVTFAPL
jgi:protein SCO1